jgi:hypothetical protein
MQRTNDWLIVIGMALVVGMLAPWVASAQGLPAPWRVEAVEALPFDPVDLRGVYPAPDGQRYVFMTETELCVGDVTGAADVCLTPPADFPPFLSVGNPTLRTVAWSPDSTRVALTGPVSVMDTDLWVWDIAAGMLTNLADDGYTGDMEGLPADATIYAQPAWSPDGTQIAAARAALSAEEPARLVVLDAVTGAVLQEIEPPVSFMYMPDDLTFSADGAALLFSQGYYGREELADSGIWRIDLASGEQTQVVTGSAFDARLNPDGDTNYSTSVGPVIVSPEGTQLLTWAGSGAFDDAPQAGFTVDTFGGANNTLPLPFEFLILSSIHEFEPFQAAWSPDGSALIIAADGAVPHEGLMVEPEADADRVTIYVVDMLEGVGRIVAEVPATNTGNGPTEDYARHDKAVWGPDGRVIIAGYAFQLVAQ